jgi:hypothetical protein
MNRPPRRPLTGPDDPRHGRPSTYVYHRCHCEKCSAGRKAAEDARNAAREPLAPGDPRHGTSRGYKTARCRCADCRAWNAAAAAARKAGRPVPERVPTAGRVAA